MHRYNGLVIIAGEKEHMAMAIANFFLPLREDSVGLDVSGMEV
jgi:hypothetical protein